MTRRLVEGRHHEHSTALCSDGHVLQQHAHLITEAARVQHWVDDEVLRARSHEVAALAGQVADYKARFLHVQ